MISFKLSDLDPELLNKIMKQNVDSIYDSARARRGRTKEEIQRAVGIGIPCEVALIQFANCKEYDHRYGDVITHGGMKIECKASKNKWYASNIAYQLNKIKDYTPADVVMFWETDGETYTYVDSCMVPKEV